jgi:formylglycine-generating enzyme required for sulfatase activity
MELKVKNILIILLLISIAKIFSATTIYGGRLESARWIEGNSPYYIHGSIEIAEDDSLVIEPGVKVIFSGRHAITVKGSIKARGLFNRKIKFEALDKNIGWLGISIVGEEGVPQEQSIFRYCEFENVRKNRVVITEGTKVLDYNSLSLITEFTKSGDLTFVAENGMVAAIDEGDVIVCGVSEATPEGLLRKVVSKHRLKDGSVQFTTEQATLKDAIADGGTNMFTKKIMPSDIVRAETKEGVSYKAVEGKDGLLSGFKLTFDEAPLGDTSTLNGYLTFEPHLFFELDVDWDLDLDFYFAIGFDETMGAEFQVTGATGIDVNETVASFPLSPIVIPCGTIPIVIVPKIEILVSANGELTGRVAVRVDQELGKKVGYRYDDGWSPINEGTNSFTAQPPHYDVEGNIKVAAGPEVSVALYGVLGLRSSFQGYSELIVDNSIDYQFGMFADIGVFLTVFGWDIFNATLATIDVWSTDGKSIVDPIQSFAITSPSLDYVYQLDDDDILLGTYATGELPDSVTFMNNEDIIDVVEKEDYPFIKRRSPSLSEQRNNTFGAIAHYPDGVDSVRAITYIVNSPPICNMEEVSPNELTTGEELMDITLSAEAYDSPWDTPYGGRVVMVEFYQGEALLGRDYEPDDNNIFSIVWNTKYAKSGDSNIYAIAYDNDNASTKSEGEPITMTHIWTNNIITSMVHSPIQILDSFIQGQDDPDLGPLPNMSGNEGPTRSVSLTKEYSLSKYETTIEQYCKMLNYALSYNLIEVDYAPGGYTNGSTNNVVILSGGVYFKTENYGSVKLIPLNEQINYAGIANNSIAISFAESDRGSVTRDEMESVRFEFVVANNNYADHPIDYTSWAGAAFYTKMLNHNNGSLSIFYNDDLQYNHGSTATGFRLPTESEWEFGAGWSYKNQDTLSTYPWGESSPYNSDGTKRCNFNSGETVDIHEGYYVEGALSHIAGNSAEWVNDIYQSYQNFSNNTDPCNTAGNIYSKRVNRGGSCYLDKFYLRNQARITDDVDPPYTLIHTGAGFRVVRNEALNVVNVEPAVRILSPEQNDIVEGVVDIVTEDEDFYGGYVTSREILIQGSQVSTTNNYSWDTNGLPGGVYTITAKATDNGGLTAVTQISVRIGDNQPPEVVILSPQEGEELEGEFSLEAQVTDPNDTIELVKFYFEDVEICEFTQPPYIQNFHTDSIPGGYYQFMVEGYDSFGAVSSEVVNVNIINNSSGLNLVVNSPQNNQSFPLNSNMEVNIECEEATMCMFMVMDQDSGSQVYFSGYLMYSSTPFIHNISLNSPTYQSGKEYLLRIACIKEEEYVTVDKIFTIE